MAWGSLAVPVSGDADYPAGHTLAGGTPHNFRPARLSAIHLRGGATLHTRRLPLVRAPVAILLWRS